MAGRYRRAVTPEQRAKAADAREAKLTAMHRTLAERVSALSSGPEWRRWLDVTAKFHSYSFNNTLLLLAQKPDATRIAGYQLWQQLGRQVNKGEKGLTILAPVTRTVQPDDDQPGQDAAGEQSAVDQRSRRRIIGFRPAYVWDITQTSGEPLPAPPRPTQLAGQAPAGLWDALTAQCQAAGFAVSRQPIAGAAYGYTDFKAREVVVRPDVDDAQAVKTLAHELGHVLMHDPTSFATGDTGGCRGTVEVEAESVAYLVAADHGLDTSSYTFAYVANWAAQTGDVEETLRATGARVLSTAHRLLDDTHAALAPPDGDAAAAAASEAAQLADRAAAGAERTRALREAAAAQAAAAPTRERLLAANDTAVHYFRSHYASSWAPAYLENRLGTSLLDDEAGIGYAPGGWTGLVDHLRREAFTDAEILAAGLGTKARTGRVVDRFRDRLMFPVRHRTEAGAVEVVGFVGRRNPVLDEKQQTDVTGPYLNPKYLNTGQTPIWTKGDHLYGLDQAADVVGRGGLAVLVEGPVDKHAVDLATNGMMAGVAALGIAVTDQHAIALRAALGDAGADRIVIAADGDPAGQRAAQRAYDMLTRHNLDPRIALLPVGFDPAELHQRRGPTALLEPLATAGPLSRQLVDQALAGVDRQGPEDDVRARAAAARIIVKAPPFTWSREIEAAAATHRLDQISLIDDVVAALDTGPDALGRLSARDRRDDLDRGQHVPGSALDVASFSAPPRTRLRPPAAAKHDDHRRHVAAPTHAAGIRR